MNKIDNIIIHCSDSDWGDVDVIREWHLARNFKDVGYNAVITNGFRKSRSTYQKQYDGKLWSGRGLNINEYIDNWEKGAHALGYNSHSLGICLIGKKEFSLNQYETLYHLCKMFKTINHDIQIIGHYECKNTDKTCPNFDVSKFRDIVSNTYNAELIRQQIVTNIMMGG